MHLLFINMTPLYHNTSAIIRMCGFISGANKNGHICDIVTLEASKDDYLYDDSNKEFVRKYVGNYYTFKKKSTYNALKAKKNNNTSVGLRRQLLKGLKKVFDQFSIYDAQNMNASKVLEIDVDFDQYDRIISISDPISSYSLVFELLKNDRVHHIEKKWIQCWGDPWISDITKNIGLKRYLIMREEKRILEKAFKIVYASPFTLREQKRLYPEFKDKMMYLNQVAQELPSETMIKKTKYLIGYFGNYNSKVRNILPLYDCCVRYHYNMVVAGGSDLKLEDDNTIHIMGTLKHQEVAKLEESTEILVAICNLSGNQIPGKAFYQTGGNKPIIIILDGELKDEMRVYFKSFNRYVLCENNINSIHNAIEVAKKNIGRNYISNLDRRLTDIFCAEKLIDGYVTNTEY
jgi:hypothetical protein